MRLTGRHLRFSTFFALAALACAQPLAAEDDIEDLVVVASRIGTVDQHVVVFDEEDLQAAGFFGSDLLRFLPNFALAPSGHRGSHTQARVRGAEANHLLVLIDGVAVNDPALGSEFGFGALDFAGIERIEFLAGPQSAVWGSDALAGALHLGTAVRRSHQRLSLGYGTQGTVDADASFARVGERGHAALSLGHVASDGTNPSLAGTEDDGFANTTAHLRAGTETGPWQLSFGARWTDAEADYDPTPAPTYLPADGDRQSETQASLLAATVRFTGSDWFAPWLHLASIRTRNDNRADGLTTDGTTGRRDTATLSSIFSFGAQRASLALEAKNEHFAQRGAPSLFGDPNQRQRIATRSVIGEYQVDLARLAVSASARRDYNDKFENATAYRLGITTKGSPRWFASAGHGVKNPTFTECFGFAPDTFIGNPNLNPEKSTGIEAGVEQTWSGSWGEAELALTAFKASLRNEIDGFVFDPGPGRFTARNIDNGGRRQGAEAMIEARLGRIRLQGAYAYVDSTSDGERRLRRPRHLASLAVRGIVTPRLSAGAGITRVGASLDRDFSTFPARRVELDGFDLLRIHADFAPTPRWKLGLVAENVLDADYSTVFGFRNPGLSAMVRLAIDL